ncbi:hypothetical protein Tco_0458680 [Tanacetum coccineum]
MTLIYLNTPSLFLQLVNEHTAANDIEVFSTDDLGLDWISAHNFLTCLQKLSSYASGHLEVFELAACLEKLHFLALLVTIDDPNITMEEYIRLEEEKARRRGKVYNWETDTYGKIWDEEVVHDLRSVETEFPAIVFDDTFTSKVTHSCEPTVSPFNDNKIDFRISFDESDDEDYTVIYDENSFSYKIISVNNLKTDSENDNKVNMPSFLSGGLN